DGGDDAARENAEDLGIAGIIGDGPEADDEEQADGKEPPGQARQHGGAARSIGHLFLGTDAASALNGAVSCEREAVRGRAPRYGGARPACLPQAGGIDWASGSTGPHYIRRTTSAAGL